MQVNIKNLTVVKQFLENNLTETFTHSTLIITVIITSFVLFSSREMTITNNQTLSNFAFRFNSRGKQQTYKI